MTKHPVCTNKSITTIAEFIATRADFGIVDGIPKPAAFVMDNVYKKRWYGSEWVPSIGGA